MNNVNKIIPSTPMPVKVKPKTHGSPASKGGVREDLGEI